MNPIHNLFRRASSKVNVKKTISQVRTVLNGRTEDEQVKHILRTLNNTIHKAAPIIEYVIDDVSSRFSKTKESTINPSLQLSFPNNIFHVQII
ncbi:unnamed protein product [Adineta steineri]|uniref:Uncharacterized protein n=1 Tax=Adineta steineri TaxID=433720 RepID=A0A819K2P7_9BILA|nr:unnamed protein product [Adineta steineri]